jgi:stage III sporulation protein AF
MSLHAWIAQLATVLLLVGVTEWLLPSGGTRGYARVILGLVVLVTMLRPLLDWAHAGVDWTALSPPSSVAVAQESRDTRDLYRNLLVDQVSQVARMVPGVASATASLTLAAGPTPTVEAVRVGVSPASGGFASALKGQVVQAVAAALGLPPDKVEVEVEP